MGYTTDFSGQVKVEPPLNAEEIAYLTEFNRTRRMRWKQGPYYCHADDNSGQAWNNPDVIDQNGPAEGQPGLWCNWTPTEDGTAIEWDGGEKFYDADDWMAYLIDHFIGSTPRAKSQLPFLQGHVCNGEIEAHGEDHNDHWMLVVVDNKVTRRQGSISYV